MIKCIQTSCEPTRVRFGTFRSKAELYLLLRRQHRMDVATCRTSSDLSSKGTSYQYARSCQHPGVRKPDTKPRPVVLHAVSLTDSRHDIQAAISVQTAAPDSGSGSVSLSATTYLPEHCLQTASLGRALVSTSPRISRLASRTSRSLASRGHIVQAKAGTHNMLTTKQKEQYERDGRAELRCAAT